MTERSPRLVVFSIALSKTPFIFPSVCNSNALASETFSARPSIFSDSLETDLNTVTSWIRWFMAALSVGPMGGGLGVFGAFDATNALFRRVCGAKETEESPRMQDHSRSRLLVDMRWLGVVQVIKSEFIGERYSHGSLLHWNGHAKNKW